MQEYYWWIKTWQIYPKVANHQNLLLANISSYAVYSNSYICRSKSSICNIVYKTVDLAQDHQWTGVATEESLEAFL